ncbi:SLATT domain-containing protein [Microbacterium sp. Be9]|uniref:SLATT domain-containing protein n=1 Tax=Microbacterium sp. Be9 TaxID=2720211 RepID=UPI001AB050A4
MANRLLLLNQVRELYGRIAYTQKTHEKQADICAMSSRRQRGWKVVLTAVGSGTFLASLFGVLLEPQWASLATSFIAVLVTAASLGDRTFRHGEEMQQHRDTAAQLWDLRESYLSLIVDLKSETVSLGQALHRRDELQKAAQAVLRDAPRTTPRAYTMAQSGLKDNEDLTFSTEEIDVMLPQALRENGAQ